MAATPAGRAQADGDGNASPAGAIRPAKGSVAAQLALQYKLQAAGDGLSLAAALDHSRDAWESLSPDEREKFRKVALAILRKDPAEQEELLAHYEKLIKMSAERQKAYERRAAWLKAVLDTLSEDEKKQLLAMPPRDRAARLIELRDKLVAEGKLVLKEPDTQPATDTSTE